MWRGGEGGLDEEARMENKMESRGVERRRVWEEVCGWEGGLCVLLFRNEVDWLVGKT